MREHTDNSITFYHYSSETEQKFPGNMEITVTYTIADDDTLHIVYNGKADADTVMNCTNHSYFNLNGHESGSIEGQVLQISQMPIRQSWIQVRFRQERLHRWRERRWISEQKNRLDRISGQILNSFILQAVTITIMFSADQVRKDYGKRILPGEWNCLRSGN